MIVLSRVDDRLIHGQCMTVIVKHYDIQEILTVEDETANNPILKRIFSMAVPKDLKAGVYNVEESLEKIKEAMESNKRVMLLMKTPETYVKLLERIEGLPKELNIGPMTKRKGGYAVNHSICIVPEEVAAIRELEDQGIRVYFRQVPSQSIIEWADVKDKL